MPSFADVVEAVSPAVVSVRVESELGSLSARNISDSTAFLDNDRQFGQTRPFSATSRFSATVRAATSSASATASTGPAMKASLGVGRSQGSGFFVSEDGYLVTNHHVVANGSKFTVVMDNGDQLDATLVGADARSDLAVLKVEADRKFTYVKFSDTPVRIGDWVVAVGNPFGLGGTVTAGIVSARNREISSNRYDDFIQIDAAVNKGNSGGPDFSLNGEVIGINTAIFSPSGGNIGIAFAIPAATAKRGCQRPDFEWQGRARLAWRADPAGDQRHRRFAGPGRGRRRHRYRSPGRQPGRQGGHQGRRRHHRGQR